MIDTPGTFRKVLGDRMLAGEKLSIPEQQLWVNDSLRVPDLWHHVLDHGKDYRAIILGPYMFWTTFAVAQIHPERTFLHPVALTVSRPRPSTSTSRSSRARGASSSTSTPSSSSPQTLYQLPERHAVIGNGMHLPTEYDPEGFRKRHGVDGRFIYYAGRREWAKGWLDLVDAFRRPAQRARRSISSWSPPARATPTIRELGLDGAIIDVGFLSSEERDDAMAAATAYVQPSALESFSRTVARGVRRRHARPRQRARARSCPGTSSARAPASCYHGHRELVEALTLLDAEPDAFRALAAGGRDYIEEHYEFDRVLDRFERTLDEWSEAP